MVANYEKDLRQAREELASLLANREQIEIEIARQKRKVAALSELCDESELGSGVNQALEALGLELGGLSDACRTAMRASRKEWMTVAEIMVSLKELGFPLDKYKAPAASVMTTVNRLVENGEAIISQHTTPGANEYKWFGMSGSSPALRRFAAANELKKKREKAEDERKNLFPLKLGQPDPLNQRGKK
jgi:hypothetical protein